MRFFVEVKSIIGEFLGNQHNFFHTFCTRLSASFTRSSIGLLMCAPRISGIAQNAQVLLQPSLIFK